LIKFIIVEKKASFILRIIIIFVLEEWRVAFFGKKRSRVFAFERRLKFVVNYKLKAY